MNSAFRSLATQQGNQERLEECKEGRDKSPEWGTVCRRHSDWGTREGLSRGRHLPGLEGEREMRMEGKGILGKRPCGPKPGGRTAWRPEAQCGCCMVRGCEAVQTAAVSGLRKPCGQGQGYPAPLPCPWHVELTGLTVPQFLIAPNSYPLVFFTACDSWRPVLPYIPALILGRCGELTGPMRYLIFIVHSRGMNRKQHFRPSGSKDFGRQALPWASQMPPPEKRPVPT